MHNKIQLIKDLSELVATTRPEELSPTVLYLLENIDISNLDAYLDCYLQQYNPILWASNFCNKPVFQRLIEILLKHGANPNLYTRCKLRTTALHNAALHNNPTTVRELLAYGANPRATNAKNETAWDNNQKTPYINNDITQFQNTLCYHWLKTYDHENAK